MARNIVRVTSSKKDALAEAKATNKSLVLRNINREAYVIPVSQAYVKTLTREGYPIPKKNYAIAIRNKLKRKKK